MNNTPANSTSTDIKPNLIIRSSTRQGKPFEINVQTGDLKLPRSMDLSELVDVAAAYVKFHRQQKLDNSTPEQLLLGEFDELIRSMALPPVAMPAA